MTSWMSRISVALVAVLLAATAQAASSVKLPVPRATIHAGSVVTNLDIVERSFPERTTQQFAVVPFRGELVGMVARRTLLPGKPVPVTAIEPQLLVKRGENARLIFRQQGLLIMMQVEVLQSGGVGETVRVRNVDSGVIVTGKVHLDGTIQVEN